MLGPFRPSIFETQTTPATLTATLIVISYKSENVDSRVAGTRASARAGEFPIDDEIRIP